MIVLLCNNNCDINNDTIFKDLPDKGNPSQWTFVYLTILCKYCMSWCHLLALEVWNCQKNSPAWCSEIQNLTVSCQTATFEWKRKSNWSLSIFTCLLIAYRFLGCSFKQITPVFTTILTATIFSNFRNSH